MGIKAEVKGIDFSTIMERMRQSIEQNRAEFREELRTLDTVVFYEDTARFVADDILEVRGERIRAKR